MNWDPAVHALCEAALREAEQCESAEQLRALPSFAAFDAVFPVPPKIVEQGDHAGLMEKDGQYAHLFSLQAKGYQ